MMKGGFMPPFSLNVLKVPLYLCRCSFYNEIIKAKTHIRPTFDMLKFADDPRALVRADALKVFYKSGKQERFLKKMNCTAEIAA